MSGESANKTRILAAVGAVGVVAFLLAVGLESYEFRLGTKAVPILCLLLWLWPPRESYSRWIFAGLILSLMGDMLLEVGPDQFLPGLFAFLLAHVAYAAAYLTATRSLRIARGLPFVILGVGAGVLLWPGLGGLTLPVTAYVVVICTMTWRSAAMLGASGLERREQWAALAGALLFAASDLLLSIKLFVRPVPGASYAIMLLYWAGQLCIALSARRPRTLPSPAPDMAV
jgi:alkenylglycerophosphocholine hydrolase